MSGYGSGAADSDALALEHVRFSTAPHTRCAPLPLVGRGWGWGSELVDAARPITRPPPRRFAPTLPTRAGQSHVEILDSNRACESAAGFQSCAHGPISIPMLRPFAENLPHAIALPTRGRGAHRNYRAGVRRPRKNARHGDRMIGSAFGVLFDGFAYGMVLFLLSVGLSVTLGMMNFVNLAHLSFAMLGGYVEIGRASCRERLGVAV